MSHWSKDILEFFRIDDDIIRFFVYGGTGAIVTGIAEKSENKKTFLQFVGLAFVGTTVSAFFTPALIDYYAITNIKYQMVISFAIGLSAMILVGKIVRAAKKFTVNIPKVGIVDKEDEEDAGI